MTTPTAQVPGPIDDILAQNIQLALSTDIDPSVKTFFQDLPTWISHDQNPSVCIWFEKLDEKRLSGGQGHGEKLRGLSLALIVTTNGVLENTDVDGIAHRNFARQIQAKLAVTPYASLGIQQGFDGWTWQRFPPQQDEQMFTYVTVIRTIGFFYVPG